MSIRRFVIVTGLSGAGKSRAMEAFEDLGFYCLDNLPPALLGDVVRLAEKAGRDAIAIAPDVRTAGPFGEIAESVASVAAASNGAPPEILFLDATDDTLIRRFSETRRRHPLAGERLTESIAGERSALVALRDRADHVWDTSALTPSQLRARIIETFARESETERLHVTLISFGYKHGLPLDADLVFDLRFLPNPYYVDELRELCGNDEPVAAYLRGLPQTKEFLERLESLLDFLLPQYKAQGKLQLTIALGCTGGRHRSVFVAAELAAHLRTNGALEVDLVERDLDR
ncbi:MAG: RNase adapter RapZ [Candidatus Eremiobacteraeota bacterium]|nr:RNase adapter RapZ [Candidatus Eremiobacteraeota bacterium]